MNPAPGEIYLIDLGIVGKVRPAVIVSRADPESPRALVVCVPLTTQYRGSTYEVALGKPRFLDKESWANVQAIMSTGHEKLLRQLGWITTTQLSSIKSALRFALEL